MTVDTSGTFGIFHFFLSFPFFSVYYGEWMAERIKSGVAAVRGLKCGTYPSSESGGEDFSDLILRVSPYLYPFSIEYSILVGN